MLHARPLFSGGPRLPHADKLMRGDALYLGARSCGVPDTIGGSPPCSRMRSHGFTRRPATVKQDKESSHETVSVTPHSRSSCAGAYARGPDLWARVKARADREGRHLRPFFLELLERYAANGLEDAPVTPAGAAARPVVRRPVVHIGSSRAPRSPLAEPDRNDRLVSGSSTACHRAAGHR